MPEEILDIIDANNNVIGQASRANTHAKKLPHRIAAVLLETADGAYLIPSSTKEGKKLLPSATGHVNTGESYIEAAARELKEETGLSATPRYLRYLGMFWREANRIEVFLAKYNVNLGPIMFNDEQEDELWLDIEELTEIYSNEPDRISETLKLILENLFGVRPAL